jgi:glutathione S-transferase
MKLHWSPRSPFVRKVMVTAHELGIADKIQTVRTFVALDIPNQALLADNPISKIPTLVLDDGTAIHDSLVICEYLNELAEGALFPPPGNARWQAMTWHALGNGLMDALLLWRYESMQPIERQSKALLDIWALKTRSALDWLEAQVPVLEAARFGIGHITIGILLSYLDFRFDHLGWRSGRPALAGWHAAMAARPSMQLTNAIDD